MSDDATGPGRAEAGAPAFDATLSVSGSSGGRGEAPAAEAPLDTLGRYRIERRLGAGAMGVVYQAHDPQLDRKVAIKVVHPRLSRRADAAERLLREARAMAKLRHPNVVSVYDAGTTDGQLFVAMELIEGTSLGELLRRRTPEEARDWERWFALMRDAGRGLAAAHAAGILHRDFKPDNVLVATDGRVCVGDFGLADVRPDDGAPELRAGAGARSPDPALDATLIPEADSEGGLRLTTTGAVVGTPAYMAPEQLRGDPVDARADQFSYCAALFEALYGVRPFDTAGKAGEAALEELRAAIGEGRMVPPPPGSRVPARLRDVVARGLAASPAARWGSMRELLAALAPPRSRAREIALVAAIAIAVIAVGVAIAVATRGGTRLEAPPVAPAVEATRRLEMPRPGFFDVGADGRDFVFVEARRAIAGRLGEPERRTVAAPAGTTWRFAVLEGPDRVMLVADGAEDILHAWTPSTGALEPVLADADLGRYLGRTWDGRLLFGRIDGDDARLLVEEDGALRVIASLPGWLSFEAGQLSPDRRRFAVAVRERDASLLAIVSLEDGAVRRLPVPSYAVGWRDDDTVLVADGQPTARISEVELADPDRPPRVVHEQRRAWITQVLVRGGVVHYQDVGNMRAARTLGIDGRAPSRDLSPTEGTQGLVWAAVDAIYARDGRTRGLVRITLDGDETAVPNDLSGEIHDATRSDDTLLVTTLDRATRTCTVSGLELGSGTSRWRRETDCQAHVRCGGDTTGRCVMYHRGGEELVARWLDPATGEVGAEVARLPLQVGVWFDVAISADGRTLAIADSTSRVRIVDLAGGGVREVTLPDNRIAQFAAVEPGGSVLVTAMDNGNAGDYSLYRLAGEVPTLIGANESRWMYDPRLSPDGSLLLVSERVFKTELWSLDE